jgi:hypothetical protein
MFKICQPLTRTGSIKIFTGVTEDCHHEIAQLDKRRLKFSLGS